jgi:hypothetical protein
LPSILFVFARFNSLLILRGISCNGPFGQAKQCVINAFDTNYLMSADEDMAKTLRLAQNMEEELPGADILAPTGPTSPVSAFGRGSHGGRSSNPRRGNHGGRGMPNKCSGCGSLGHILSSSTASDDALLKWKLAKRKLIVKKYGNSSHASARAALLSDLSHEDTSPREPLDVPTLEKCTGVYDDTEVSLSFSSVAFSSSLTPGRDL